MAIASNGRSYKDKIRDGLLQLQTHPAVRRLRGVAQLGQLKQVLNNPLVYSHTRFDHVMYATEYATQLFDVLSEKGMAVRWEVVPATLLHDLGHPPYSHIMEYMLKDLHARAHPESPLRGHNARTLELLEATVDKKGQAMKSLNQMLEDIGANPAITRRYIEKHPVGSLEHSRGDDLIENPVVGIDKAMYLAMDSQLINFDQRPPSYAKLMPYLTIQERGLGVDLSAGSDYPEAMIKATQLFYFRMYLEAYVSPDSQGAQRHMQRAFGEEMRVHPIDIETVWWWEDADLEAYLSNAQSEAAAAFYAGYENHHFFKPALVFKLRHDCKIDGRKTRQVVIDDAFKDAFLRHFGAPTNMIELEHAIEKEFGMRVLCTSFPDPKKLDARDLPVHDGARFVGTLHERNPEYFNYLKAEVRAAFDIGFRFSEHDLPKALHNAQGIAEFVQAQVKSKQDAKTAAA